MFDTLINDKLFRFQNSRMQNNSYVIINKWEAAVIDPSWNGNKIITFLKEKNVTHIKILITHAHYDHIVDIDKIYKSFEDVTFYISNFEMKHLTSISKDMTFKSPMEVPIDRIYLIESQKNQISIGDEIISVFLCPGHSKGCISYIYDNYIFTGDFIFSDCIGRVDLPTGSMSEMKRSLNRFLEFVKDTNIICPGHNEIALFKIVKAYNDEIFEYAKKDNN